MATNAELQATAKTVLRISHNKLDDEILRLIQTARRDLIRVGVKEEKANAENDLLIDQAIVTYCLMNLAESERKAELYKISYESQIDGIRKNRDYYV